MGDVISQEKYEELWHRIASANATTFDFDRQYEQPPDVDEVLAGLPLFFRSVVFRATMIMRSVAASVLARFAMTCASATRRKFLSRSISYHSRRSTADFSLRRVDSASASSSEMIAAASSP